MEEFRNWGLLLLFISAGSLIYCFLLPSGNVSKTAKAVVSIVVLICLNIPVIDIFDRFSSDAFSFSEVPEIESFDDELTAEAKRMIEEIIKQTIRKYTDVPYRTEILVDKNADNSINIEYVKIVFDAKPLKEEELRNALYENLGIMADIRVELISEQNR